MRPVVLSLRVRVVVLLVASAAVLSGIAPPRHAAADATYGIAVMRDVIADSAR